MTYGPQIKTETLLKIVEGLEEGLNYSAASRSALVSLRTFWNYTRLSQNGDERFRIPYLGEENVFFHEACSAARRIHGMNVRSTFESYCLTGLQEPVTYNGQLQWQVDRRTVGWSEDERENLGFSRDGLLRNSAGETIPLTITRKPSDAAVLRFLEMAVPTEYRPTSNQNITVNNLKTQGATRGERPTAPPAIPEKPIPPQLEILEPEPADDLADMLGPEPEPVFSQTEQEPVVQAEQPEATVEKPPLTALQKDLMSYIKPEPKPFTDEIEPALVPEPVERVIREAPPDIYQPPEQTGPLAPGRGADPLPPANTIPPALMALLKR